MTGTYQDFLVALGYSESSNRDWYVNANGYAGYFQMGESALRVTGYYGPDSTPATMDLLDGWTAKAKAEGVGSLQDFLANHAFQEKAITAYFSYLWGGQWGQNFEGSNLKEFVGQTIGGVTVTVSGLMAGSHLVGANNVEAFLRSGGATVPTDPFGTTVVEYLTKFGGYDMAPVIGADMSSPTKLPINVQVPALTSAPVGQVLQGTASNGTFFGSQGDDHIVGKNGNDWMNGGSGNDHLWGSHGSDIFAFAAQFGQDTIEDFLAGPEPGHEFIFFVSDRLASFDDVMSSTTDTADGALIATDDGSVLLKGVLKSALVATNFYFI